MAAKKKAEVGDRLRRVIEVNSDWLTTLLFCLIALGFVALTFFGSVEVITNSHWIYFQKPTRPGAWGYVNIVLGAWLTFDPRFRKIERTTGLVLGLLSIGRLIAWSRLTAQEFQLLTFSGGVVLCGCFAACFVTWILGNVRFVANGDSQKNVRSG